MGDPRSGFVVFCVVTCLLKAMTPPSMDPAGYGDRFSDSTLARILFPSELGAKRFTRLDWVLEETLGNGWAVTGRPDIGARCECGRAARFDRPLRRRSRRG
jgi:hypothetical protein